MDGCSFALPLAAERGGNVLHPLEVAKAVAEENDVLEAVSAITAADLGQQPLVRIFGQADGASVFHMVSGRIDVALRDEGDDWCDERVAKLACDGFGGGPANVIVLPHRQ